MIEKIDHIGIAVNSIEERLRFFKDMLSLELAGTEEINDQKVKVAFVKVGDVNIELLEPTDPASPIAKFIAKKGEGIHHIALKTNNISETLKHLNENNITLIDTTPRQGAHGKKIAFIHPKSTGGVLIELCQE
ncbi:MAG: methylmalonyl-CoA epimerase [Candidatus Neomarinimicrobiota bacterium]|nr:methylmalonyl-CoA epimerase [Candidatus Neomarinimicrobiota bacterium]RKY50012.1 MAG: methylmalonyl-CoA epimerase [Candidatus Neomarinimicrobiota bacterium]HDN58920.1 methylmalonyl-CoA epimerase [Candidatus Neomarinimicrobiota bacterium]